MNILLNYASGRFIESQLKNCISGLETGFNVIYKMSDRDIDEKFRKENDKILSQRRGAGYWLWKPYFIDRMLHTMTVDDILFYSDSGSVFIANMNPIFSEIRQDEKGIICFTLAGKHIEKHWTKRDLMKHMDLLDSKYTDTPQRMASFLGVRRTQFSHFFFKEYLNLSTNYSLISDEPNSDGWVEPGFNEHRHDQSIFSLLTKKHEIKMLPDPTQWGLHHQESKQTDHYIFHTRDPK